MTEEDIEVGSERYKAAMEAMVSCIHIWDHVLVFNNQAWVKNRQRDQAWHRKHRRKIQLPPVPD